MEASDIKQIREAVAQIGARIQPQLLPHESLAQRNAFAHIWLGVRTTFGEHWRATGCPGEVTAFIAWIGENPNADYESFTGQVTPCLPPLAKHIDKGLFD